MSRHLEPNKTRAICDCPNQLLVIVRIFFNSSFLLWVLHFFRDEKSFLAFVAVEDKRFDAVNAFALELNLRLSWVSALAARVLHVRGQVLFMRDLFFRVSARRTDVFFRANLDFTFFNRLAHHSFLAFWAFFLEHPAYALGLTLRAAREVDAFLG